MVINKEIRKKLGIEPGWLALQRIVDDHVEIYFLPPEHNRSLRVSWRLISRHTSLLAKNGTKLESGRGNGQLGTKRD